MPGELHRWRHNELIREGDLLAEVPVEGTYDESWSPRISLADARKLGEVRLALRRRDLPAAARHARVFAMRPMSQIRPSRTLTVLLFCAVSCLVAQQLGSSGWAGEAERATGNGAAESRAAPSSSAAEASAVRRLPPRGPYQETIHYEPSQCSPPVTDGKVRIMLGRLVLAWSQDKVAISRGLSREEVAALPPPPDASQPEGCPDNPVWGGTFTLAFSYPGIAEDGSEQVEWASAGLVYSTRGRAGIQEVNEKITKMKCEQAPPGSIKEVLPSGFTVCRYKPDIEWPVERWGTSFVGPLDLYAMPDGRPFIVSCLFGELTSGAYGCPVNYRLYRYVNVYYKVNFRRTSIDEVIAMDKALRQAVEEAAVSDYTWRDGKAAEIHFDWRVQ